MTWLCGSGELLPSGWLTSAYPGAGIRGAEIPTGGSNGGSPVLNDGITADNEYRWQIEVPPAKGKLTLFEDLSALYEPTDDGAYSAAYRLWENNVDRGVGTMYFTVGEVASALAGDGAALASGSARVSVVVWVGGLGSAAASGTGAPIATVSIAATALAQAAAQAGLSAQVLRAASGAAAAAGNAALAARLELLATGAASAGGAANLTGGPPGALNAAGHGEASGAAVLSINIALNAGGASIASGSANGEASTPDAMRAIGRAEAAGLANWSAALTLTAHGFVEAMAAGQMRFDVPIDAFGAGRAGGRAALQSAGQHANFGLFSKPDRLTYLVCGALHLNGKNGGYMANKFLLGEVILLPLEVRDQDGKLADPGAIVLKVRVGTGNIETYDFGAAPEIIRDVEGRYRALIPAMASGRLFYRWELTGDHSGATEGEVVVGRGRF